MAKTILRKCKVCHKYFEKCLSTYKNDLKRGTNAGKFCSKECFYKSPERSPNLGKKGKESSGWKGGRLYERGYKMVVANDHPKGVLKGGGVKYVREHRLIMEKHIGRYLRDDEIIHHINEDKSDNRIENLEITNYVDHSRYHMNNYWKNKDTCKSIENGEINPREMIK